MKKNSKSPMKKEQKAKRAKAQRPMRRETKEVLAELVACIRIYDRKIEELGSGKYGHTKLLRQVKGVEHPRTSVSQLS